MQIAEPPREDIWPGKDPILPGSFLPENQHILTNIFSCHSCMPEFLLQNMSCATIQQTTVASIYGIAIIFIFTEKLHSMQDV